MTAAILAVLALVSVDPDPMWNNDILVWDMNLTTTWMGDGYVYCNAMYLPNGDIYAASVMDITGGQGDALRIFVSQDDGVTWTLGSFATGGTWSLYEPEFMVSSGAPDYILLFYAARQAGQQGMTIVARYQLPGFTLLDGYIVDYSNPQADEMLSYTVARDPESGTIWHFTCDASSQLFLSKSYDDGVTWTASELVASYVARPTATAGPGGHIFVAYQRTGSTGNVRCLVLTESGSYVHTVGVGAADAAPIPACEWTGSPIDLGVVYHTSGGDVVLASSQDFGQTWGTPSVLAQGSYPFIDIYPGSRKPCMAFLDAAGTGVMVSRAWGIPGLLTASPSLRSDQTPTDAGPPVIRYSPVTTDAEVYGLFYMGDGPQDLWYDSSILTGIEEGSTTTPGIPVLGLEPNPFTGSTFVRLTLASACVVELGVYSMDGRLVQHLYSGYTGNDVFAAGENLPAGVYTVVLVTETGTESIRMVKLQ